MKKIKLSENYDIVIVGAGPAGCNLANNLSTEYNVLLLDWSRIPRDKPCGGLLVEESQRIMKKLQLPKSIFSFPKDLDMMNIDWNNDLKAKTKRNFLNITRISFDYWLLKLSQAKVDFLSETKFIDFEKKGNTINVLLEKNNKKEIIKTRYLIGANGAISNIRNDITNKRIRYYFAMQEFLNYDFKDPEIQNNFTLIYDNDITDFYSWLVPKGNNLLIGSAIPKIDVDKKFNLFRQKLKEKMGISGSVTKKEVSVILRPESTTDIFLGKDNILLLGEAAGFISPSTGEGISFALRSSYNCAKALNESPEKALREYKNLSTPLIEEILYKLQKSSIISDPKKRKQAFSNMDKNI